MYGRRTCCFKIAEAALPALDGAVSQVLHPAVRRGEQTLRELVHEYKTKGRHTVQTTLKASHTNHYRRGMIDLFDALESAPRAADRSAGDQAATSGPGT